MLHYPLLAAHGLDTLVFFLPPQLPRIFPDSGPLHVQFPLPPKLSDLNLVAPFCYRCRSSARPSLTTLCAITVPSTPGIPAEHLALSKSLLGFCPPN